MSINNTVVYPNGARLLLFPTGKTKYMPSKRYVETKTNMLKPFRRKPTIEEACNKFFTKIFEEAERRSKSLSGIKKVDNLSSGKSMAIVASVSTNLVLEAISA